MTDTLRPALHKAQITSLTWAVLVMSALVGSKSFDGVAVRAAFVALAVLGAIVVLVYAGRIVRIRRQLRQTWMGREKPA